MSTNIKSNEDLSATHEGLDVEPTDALTPQPTRVPLSGQVQKIGAIAQKKRQGLPANTMTGVVAHHPSGASGSSPAAGGGSYQGQSSASAATGVARHTGGISSSNKPATPISNTVSQNSGNISAGYNPSSSSNAKHSNVQNSFSSSNKGPVFTDISVREWHEILKTVGKLRGHSVVELAKFIIEQGFASNALHATALAADLLENADDQLCENLVTLLTDGWDQSLGALLSCARTL
jgi:hypothetical protein